jgi:hypothetical protein
MAPSARVPNTSGTAFASMVSVAAKPMPSISSEPKSASREESPRSATSASSWTT